MQMQRLGLLVLLTLRLSAADAVKPDSSQNSLLSGKYWVRDVIYKTDINGSPLYALSATGAMTFDGKGAYAFAGQSFDSRSTPNKTLSLNGTYRAGAGGISDIDSILHPAATNTEGGNENIYGGVGSNGIFSGSATEGNYIEVFVAIPAGSKIATNSSLQGAFWLGSLDIPKGVSANAKNSLFQIAPDGQGRLESITVKGRDAAQQNTVLSQTVTSATYSFGSDGAGSIVFPAPAGVAQSAALFVATKTLYVSADGNYILGGDPNGSDIFFGFRPVAGTGSPASSLQGVYYYAGVESDASDPQNLYMVGEYGSFNRVSADVVFWHQRMSPFNNYPYDFTFDSGLVALDSDGALNTTYFKSVPNATGDAVLYVGNGTEYAFDVGVGAPRVTASGVFLSPTGVVNAASYSPPTNPVAPGELITLFGSNLANSTNTASTLPFPSSLDGVQVLINDRPAPVYAVSPTQISAIVPYATSGSYASVKVVNNGQPSNTLIMYLQLCAPGIFAVPAVGHGYGAVLHADFSLVSPSNPAKQGETVQIYLTGLGAVKPGVTDGSAGPTSPLSVTVGDYGVYFGKPTAALYNGLAPGAAGLYQVNITIPKDSPTGDVYLDLSGGPTGSFCENSQVKIPIVAVQ
jgi:uncharacterized protein (TIGR03437 family)